MAKFNCRCGYTISDGLEYMSNRAHYIANQDYWDLLDKLEPTQAWEENAHHLAQYCRQIYQCPQCNNLIFFAKGSRFDFNPLSDNTNNLLSSYLGTQWKGMLRGHYRKNTGEVFWQTNLESGFKQGLTQAELEALYYRKFEQLNAQQILRDAFLEIDGETVHKFDINKI
ncbi:hypothetical protein EKN56_02505 [Limnobaculum zhutongyuii]|uniref:Uncharacterized protein n=1 Tax=Limnobaculum zhutongyuii TaxID=2498113 RepID=A0A411WGM9_9GAMM|nr:hypothetical protein [Limnobaculum zhutongyuii]QBH95372.1 hypothetical protein EKN56_02505 [Limnobaculum zhutongyuii]TQS89010.1 hypothetical protein ELQ32_07395 [Limnobaculum zhutongyuii]